MWMNIEHCLIWHFIFHGNFHQHESVFFVFNRNYYAEDEENSHFDFKWKRKSEAGAMKNFIYFPSNQQEWLLVDAWIWFILCANCDSACVSACSSDGNVRTKHFCKVSSKFFYDEHATLKYFTLHSFIKTIQIRLNQVWNYGKINFY